MPRSYLSDPNFVWGLSFIDVLILASRTMLFDTIYRTRRKIVQCFDQERERYQKEGQKGLLLSFLDPGSSGPSEDFILKGPACLGETVTSGVSLGLPR